MTISKELLDELLKGCERPEDLLGDAGLMKELKIRLMERMLGAELTATAPVISRWPCPLPLSPLPTPPRTTAVCVPDRTR